MVSKLTDRLTLCWQPSDGLFRDDQGQVCVIPVEVLQLSFIREK